MSKRNAYGSTLGFLSGLFYSNEGGEPSHIHVRSAGKEAKLWLHDCTVAANAGFPAHELADIIRVAKAHRDELLAAWNEHFGD